MSIVVLPGRVQDVDEPDWQRLIPDVETRDSTTRMDAWREFARQQWGRVIQELRDSGTLAAVNGHQVQRLVLAYVRYDMAAAKLFQMSAITTAPKTGTPMLNIWQVEMRAADSDATSAEMELCLNPRRRGSATAAMKKQRRAAAADGYLARKA